MPEEGKPLGITEPERTNTEADFYWFKDVPNERTMGVISPYIRKNSKSTSNTAKPNFVYTITRHDFYDRKLKRS